MVGCGKTNTLLDTNTLYLYRMSTILTSCTCVAFESSTNKTLNPYNFCRQNSYKTHFGALESFVNR